MTSVVIWVVYDLAYNGRGGGKWAIAR